MFRAFCSRNEGFSEGLKDHSSYERFLATELLTEDEAFCVAFMVVIAETVEEMLVESHLDVPFIRA